MPGWFGRHFGGGTYIYVFWNQRKCVYVGKTAKSGGRISGHFEKHWFGSVTRIDVYHATGRRALPALECLAIHRFQPARNKFRAERNKRDSRVQLFAPLTRSIALFACHESGPFFEMIRAEHVNRIAASEAHNWIAGRTKAIVQSTLSDVSTP